MILNSNHLNNIEDGIVTVESQLNNKIDWFSKGISIPSDSDLDTYTEQGKYFAANDTTANSLVNCPTTSNFVMYVFKRTGGPINQLIMTRTTIYMRGNNTSGTWSAWNTFLRVDSDGGALAMTKGGTGANDAATARTNLGFQQKILWEGGQHMDGSQTATLSEAISNQPFGIILVFSAFDRANNVNYDWGYHYFFIPKWHTQNLNGRGVNVTLQQTPWSDPAGKYLYIYDTYIKGNDLNTTTGTKNGITYANDAWVMRYVLGV